MEKVVINYKMQEESKVTEFKTIGKLQMFDNYVYLEFIEKETNINSKYMLYDNKMLLERKGSLSMQAEFIQGKNTSCTVTTDFGYNMNVNIYTSFYNIDKETNNIKLIYELDIDKGNKHILDLEYKNKNISIAKK